MEPQSKETVSPNRQDAPTKANWFAHAFIALYLGWLGHGVVCHALQFRVGAHPAMYFTVWDMFCGWSAWADRTHIVAEGESGRYYELTTPWQEYHPFSDLGRQHYDPIGHFGGRIGAHRLRHTRHEPIRGIHLISESWSKKFNLPDSLWHALHDEPRRPTHYFRQTASFSPDGRLVAKKSAFLDRQRERWLAASIRGQTQNRSLLAVQGGR